MDSEKQYQPYTKEEIQHIKDYDIPLSSRWRHKNDIEYAVIMFTNYTGGDKQDRYPFTICYKNVWTGEIFSRPARDWHRSMTLISKKTVEDLYE